MSPSPPSTRMSRAKKAAVIVAGLVGLYAAAGFLVAPPILRSKAVGIIGEQIDREVSIDKIRINPFALSLTVKGFEVKEPNGDRFAGFEELYLNLQLSSVFRRALTFATIRLTAPDGHLAILSDGRLNVSDILPKSDQTKPGQDSGKLPPLVFFDLSIEQGRFKFSDLSLPTPYERTLFPVQLKLKDFNTRKDRESSYSFTATVGESALLNVDGNISINPLRSRGRMAATTIDLNDLWKYIQDLVNFEVKSGFMDLESSYVLDGGGGGDPVFKLHSGNLSLTSFSLIEKTTESPVIELPSFSSDGIKVDLSKRQVLVASVVSKDARLFGWLSSEGRLMYETVFALDGLKNKFGGLFEARGQAPGETEPWQFTAKDAALENYGFTYEDRTLAKPVRIELKPIKVEVQNLSTEKGSELELSLEFKVEQTGSVAVEGTSSINPVRVNISFETSKVPLKPLQPYLDSVAQLKLVSGTTSFHGKVTYNGTARNQPKLHLQAGVVVENLDTVDRSLSENFIKLESLAATGLIFELAPNRLKVSEVTLREPYAKVTIWPDGKVNVVEVFSPQQSDSPAKPDSLLDRLARYIVFNIRGPVPIVIDRVVVKNGSADFSDFAIRPKFSAKIYSLEGIVRDLSSDPSSRAKVQLHGKVGDYAPVEITGRVSPLSEDQYVDLALSFKNFELTMISPYARKFAGYSIEKGKVAVDLRYKVENDIFTGENEIFLKQFTLGERTDSRDATSLPIRLAVALLKDSNGNIELNVPIRGDLDSPQFEFDKVIAGALVSTVAKIVSSPFALLGRLVGGNGEELSSVGFEFGRTTLGTEQIEKLSKLAEALHQRPELQLEIKGTADRENDRAALAEAELLDQLKRMKMEKSNKGAVVDSEGISLAGEEYNRLVIQAYKKNFDVPPEDLLPKTSDSSSDKLSYEKRSALVAAAKERLIETIQIGDATLQQIARDRAAHIREHLIERGEIKPERLFTMAPEVGDFSTGAMVHAELSLSGF